MVPALSIIVREWKRITIVTRVNYETEIAICDMYIKLVKKYASENKISRQEFTDTILPECAPLYKRMHNAKSMLSKAQS